MIPGRKIFAIFGFCDIHNFNVANEVLEEVSYIKIFCILKVIFF